MNYFDRLMQKRVIPVMQPTSIAQSTAFSDPRDAALFANNITNLSQPDTTPLDFSSINDTIAENDRALAPVAQPSQIADRSATPSMPQSAPAQPAPQPQVQPTAPQPAPVYDGNTSHTDMTAEQDKANADVRSIIGTAVSNGWSHDQLDAALRPYGISSADLKNLDVNEAHHRADPRAVVQVATDDSIGRAQRLADSLDRDYPIAKATDGSGSVILNTHHNPVTGIGALGYGIGQGITLGGADEGGSAIGATVNSLANMVGAGTPISWGDAYHYLHGQAEADLKDADTNHGGAYLTGQFVGGLAPALVTGGDSAALQAGGLRAAGRMAVDGAAYGGAQGFLSSDGGFENRLRDGAIGAIGGAIAAPILGTPINAVARRVGANVEAGGNIGKRVMDAADDLNARYGADNPVQPLLGNTSHGGLASAATGALDDTALAGRLGGLHASRKAFDDAAGEIGERIAANETQTGVSDMASTAARTQNADRPGTMGSYAEASKDAAQSIYAPAEALAGKAQIPTPRTVGVLRDIIAEWQRNPALRNDGAIGAFGKLLQRLTAGEAEHAGKDYNPTGMAAFNALLRNPQGKAPTPTASAKWTAQGLRDLRTSFGDELDAASGSVKGASRYAHEAANKLWPALSQDIQTGLRLSGNDEAAGLYRQADRQWAIRQRNVEAIQKLIGRPDDNWSADRVASNIVRASETDYKNLRTAMDAIDPAYAAEIRGGLIMNLGKARAGTATAAVDDRFNLNSFTTNWTKLSNKAKRALYSNQTIADLDKLATLGYSQRASGLLMNGSRTAYANDFIQTILRGSEKVARWGAGLGAAGSIGAGAIGVGHISTGGLLLSASGAVGLFGVGRFLASPGIARALVRFSNSGNVAAFSRGLQRIATRNPALVGPVGQIISALNGSPADDQSAPASPQPKASVNPFDQFDGQDAIDLGAGRQTSAPNPFDQFDGDQNDIIELK